MKRLSVLLSAILSVLIFSVASFAAPGDNLCLEAEVVNASGYVNEEETPEHMIDGNVDTKWCSSYDPEKVRELYTNGSTSADLIKHIIILDFGEEKIFNKYAIVHASLCERDFNNTEMNAAEWILEGSSDCETWVILDEVTQNTQSITEKEIPLTEARYVRLIIIKPSQDGSDVVRIPELQIFESDSSGTVTETGSLAEIKQIEENISLTEKQEKAQEMLVLILIIIGMIISLGILYTLKYISYKKEKEAE